MKALVERYAAKGLVVLGLNAEEDEAKEAKFARAKEIRYPILLGAKDLLETYGVPGFPTNVLVDREGILRDRQIGFSEKHLVGKLESLLGVKGAGAGSGN